MGTPLKVLQKDDEWYKVETPEGYQSYIPGSSIQMLDSAAFYNWKHAKRYIVTAYQSQLTTQPGGDETVSDLVLGNILEYKDKKASICYCPLPTDARDMPQPPTWKSYRNGLTNLSPQHKC